VEGAGPTLDDPRTGPPPDDELLPRKSSSFRSIAEWVVIVAAAVAVAIVIRTFVLQAFYIPSASMDPTLKIDDKVLVNKLSYKFHDIHRGDIVVFERPPGETALDIKDLIKRVIGLPGDVIEGRDGHVYINGRQLNEPYLPAEARVGKFERQTVPKGDIFVMGDNRGSSRDSRSFGPISEDLVVGRAFVRVWPLSDLSFL
jgi:signal peptidase I